MNTNYHQVLEETYVEFPEWLQKAFINNPMVNNTVRQIVARPGFTKDQFWPLFAQAVYESYEVQEHQLKTLAENQPLILYQP